MDVDSQEMGMRLMFFILMVVFVSCEKTSTVPVYLVDSEKNIEVRGVRVEWTDGKNRAVAFPREITYSYTTGDAFFSSITGVITNLSGRKYFVEAERGNYREKTKEGEAENVLVRVEEGNFRGDLLISFFSQPVTMVVNNCAGNYGKLSISAEECRFFTEEEILVLSGNVNVIIQKGEK